MLIAMISTPVKPILMPAELSFIAIIVIYPGPTITSHPVFTSDFNRPMPLAHTRLSYLDTRERLAF